MTYLERRHWHIYPDVNPALKKLSQAGWKHALLTNHVPELGPLLDDLGLQRSLIGVFNSAETGVEKPHARAFANVLNELKPETAWMVGDNPVADVAGAEAMRLPAILVRNEASRARYACADLYKVADLLTQQAEN